MMHIPQNRRILDTREKRAGSVYWRAMQKASALDTIKNKT